MRTAQQLIELWNKATIQNKLILGEDGTVIGREDSEMVLNKPETELFFKTLKQMNRPGYSSPFQIAKDYEGYDCPVTGKWIEGRYAHKENLKRQGCRVFEPGELEEFKRNKPRDVERNAEIFANEICEKIGERIGDL